MFPDLVLASVVIGLFRGGSLKEPPRIEKIWLLALAILLQASTPFLPAAGSLLMAGSYLCLFFLGVANWASPGFRLLTVGTILNAVVIIANGGRMPVEEVAALALNYDTTYLYSDAFSQYVIATPDTPLAFLSDVILLRYPIPRVVSIGDLFAGAGLFVLVQEILGKPAFGLEPAAAVLERGD